MGVTMEGDGTAESDFFSQFVFFQPRKKRTPAPVRIWLASLMLAVGLSTSSLALAAGNRSTYIPYDMQWISGPNYTGMAFDAVHQQIFTAWTALDRIDVLSAVDYHVIQSIRVPSPESVDISPDGTTLAVATYSAHILFFDTQTFAKTNDLVFANSSVGVSAFVYAANGNGIIRAEEGLSTGGGITAYWNQAANAFPYISQNVYGGNGSAYQYQTTGPIARSGDYSKILIGDASSGGNFQVIDANSGQVIQQTSFGGYILALAANKDASRFAVCVEPAGYAPGLVIMDSSLNQLYEDEAGCYAITISADGSTLYRDASVNNTLVTQALNLTTFATTNVTTYFSAAGSEDTIWQAADSTGMVYGVNHGSSGVPVFVAVDTTQSSTPAIPAANDPVKIVRVVDNIGSPQGGDLIRILCTGADNADASSASVTIGGQSASGVTIAQISSLYLASTTLPNLRLVEVRTPAGTPGLADVTLTVDGKSDTASNAFQYAQSTKIYPFSTSPTFLLYDKFRQKLYAAHTNQVEVIDPIAQQVLTPLVPVSGRLTNSQFAGLSLSPDGNRLYIADAGANLIHELDLSNPGTGASINPQTALGYFASLSPGRVFETASGMLVGSTVGTNTAYHVFAINRASGTGAWIQDASGSPVTGYAWNSANKGAYVVISRDVDQPITGQVGMWVNGTSSYAGATSIASIDNEIFDPIEVAANEDGTIIATLTGFDFQYNPEVADFTLHSAGIIADRRDIPIPTGTASLSLHPSGALMYQAGTAQMAEGISPFGGLVEIDDLHQLQPVATLEFPEAIVTSANPFLTSHMLTADQTGRYFFGVTASGITEMVLNTIPLSIGHLQPPFGTPGGGEAVTIRGSGFQAGAIASFGGVQASTTFVDPNTLTATLPALSAGWQDVTVTNTNSSSYTAPGIFQVIAPPPTPAIAASAPSVLLAGSGTTVGGDTIISVTLQGSGFAPYDTVEINWQPIASAFLDASDLQTTIDASLATQTGSITFTVISPYTGTSNTFSVPVINPVPAIDDGGDLHFVTSTDGTGLWVYGTGFVTGSVVQWNGQNLAGSLLGGESTSVDELIMSAVPANYLTGTGTATITVVNPPPGGGTSNSVTVNLASASPQMSIPSSIDFGQVVLNSPASQTVQLTNTGTADYKMASFITSSGPFSVQANGCADVPPKSSCNLQIQLSTTTAGTAMGTVTITDNSSFSPHATALTGTVVASLAPTVAITSVNAVDQTSQAYISGTAALGGSSVPGTAWLEYGTSPTLATYSQSSSWSFQGDGTAYLSGGLTGLSPATTYAVRLAVQDASGIGKSPIRLFATMAAPPTVALGVASGSSSTATISAGQTATFQLVASDGGNGYIGTATLTCTGAPFASTCAVSPSTVNIGLNPAAFTVTITTTGSASVLSPPPPTGRLWAMALLLILMAMVVTVLPRRRYALRLVMWLAAVALFAFACGGGGASGGGSSPPVTIPTPSGTYGISINASAGSVQTTYLLLLTVK